MSCNSYNFSGLTCDIKKSKISLLFDNIEFTPNEVSQYTDNEKNNDYIVSPKLITEFILSDDELMLFSRLVDNYAIVRMFEYIKKHKLKRSKVKPILLKFNRLIGTSFRRLNSVKRYPPIDIFKNPYQTVKINGVDAKISYFKRTLSTDKLPETVIRCEM